MGSGRSFGGRIRQDRVRGGIFKRKERIGEVVEGVGDAGGPGARDEDNVTAVVGEGGTDDVEGPDTMMVPRLASQGGVVGHHKLTGGMEGVGGEVDGRTVQTVPRRQRRV